MQLFWQESQTVISSYHRFLITHGSVVVHVNEPLTVAVAEARDSITGAATVASCWIPVNLRNVLQVPYPFSNCCIYRTAVCI